MDSGINISSRKVEGIEPSVLLKIFRARFSIYSGDNLIDPSYERTTKNNPLLRKMTGVESHYIDINKYKIDCDEHDFSPDTTHIFAESNGNIIAYLRTIAQNQKVHLPLQKSYGREFDDFRALHPNSKAVEIARLIIHPNYRKNNSGAFSVDSLSHKLFTATILSSVISNVSHYFIEVNPDASSFYRENYLFEQIGEKKEYAELNNAPAVLMNLDLEKSFRESKEKDCLMSDAYRKVKALRDSFGQSAEFELNL